MSKVILGVDEVAVGAIAGPLIVAAVAFMADAPCPVLSVHRGTRWRQMFVCDSKKVQYDLLPAFRTLILDQCLASALVYKLPHEVDALGVDGARDAATVTAVQRVLERIKLLQLPDCDEYMVVLDGDITSPLLDARGITYHAVAHADRDVWQVSAASILAKEAQVLFLEKLHRQYPQYGFDKHHGYPTKTHITALRKHGVTLHHRQSYRTIRDLK